MVTIETVDGSEFDFEYVIVKENGIHVGYADESDQTPEKVFPENSVLHVDPEMGIQRYTEAIGEKVQNTHDGGLYASEYLIEYRIE